jgi:uncharacterized cupredoxin-like copper-binding protein
LAIIAVLVLAVGSTVAFGAATGAFRSNRVAPNGGCSAPSLSGSIVDVRLMNMGGSMMNGMGGTMRLAVTRHSVPDGQVSFRVANVGSLVHELVVLPLTGGQVGRRPVDAAHQVDESGSLGEASRSCGAGAGDGIDPGSIGWVSINLPAGDYELICNLPGHYTGGMYTDLHVQ